MTSTTLTNLLRVLRPTAPGFIAGLPCGHAPDLAAALALPWYAYECRPTPGCLWADEDGLACRPASFSLALVTPTDDECRTMKRLTLAARILVPGGVIVYDSRPGYRESRHLTGQYEQVYRLGEIVVGAKRAAYERRAESGSVPLGTWEAASYALPASPDPGESWRKTKPHPEEIAALVASQEFQKALAASTTKAAPGLRPLLPLSTGHLAQALGTGVLDGPITLADGRRAAIRGFAGKASYQKTNEHLRSRPTLCDNVTLAVYGERPHLWIRLVDEQGRFDEYAAATE